MKLVTKRGFTLIELLVVISIIGLLGSVVLASLSDARGKGSDAAIKSTLINIRTQAELLFATDYSFENVCGDSQDPTIAKAISEANALNGSGSVTCVADRSGWAVAAEISEGAFCVDADGVAKTSETLAGAITNESCN